MIRKEKASYFATTWFIFKLVGEVKFTGHPTTFPAVEKSCDQWLSAGSLMRAV
jgi:hypothetical protein